MKIMTIVAIIILLGVGYYLLSPVVRVVTVEEQSPLSLVSSVEEMQQVMEKAASQPPVVMEEPMPPIATITSRGTFQESGGHTVSGTAVVIESNGERTLRFEDFFTVNGPDLRIYLATDTSATDYIEVSKIKGTKGNINYNIDPTIDVKKYKYVLIWCKPFGVLFSFAVLL